MSELLKLTFIVVLSLISLHDLADCEKGRFVGVQIGLCELQKSIAFRNT